MPSDHARRRRIRATAAGALCALTAGALAGCSDDPRLLNANTGGIAVALGDPDNAMAQAAEVANQHCVNVRRVAVLRDVQEVGGERVAFFDCVSVSPAAR